MKHTIKKFALGTVAGFGLLSSCSKFEEINKDPYAAGPEQVQVEYFINGSIVGAQMDPHISERIFTLYWKTAGRQAQGGGISSGGYNDGWSSDYWSRDFAAGWLARINSGIKVANEKITTGNIKPYTENLLHVARIWRAYLMSELADTFGPIPLDGFEGQNPSYSSEKDVYYFMLEELRDASGKLDLAVDPNAIAKFDPAYGFNWANWQKFANSLRMRFAMRLSEVDAAKAKTEFEAAAAGPFITTAAETFKVAERPGWDALTGVMTREWNAYILPATLNNLYLNLGSIKSADQLPGSMASAIKPEDYMGVRYLDHFPSKINDPSTGYWLDGLPNVIDPRAYKSFAIPGDFANPDFNVYPTWTDEAKTTTRALLDENGEVFKTIDAKYTWNASSNGDWGAAGTRNQLRVFPGTMPRLANRFRNSSSERIFFAPWESYFLVAEAAVRNWTVPMNGQTAYEEGIRSSFEYWGVSSFLADYLASTSYNRAGTSVAWNHTTEPPATYPMNYVDGYTNTPGVAQIKYADNTLYQGGTVKNDHLTKIITQKFIAQNPWLPLETWSDHRRLGLPFFENPAVENPLVNMPDLNSGNYMTSNVKFFPQRIKYPSSFENSNPKGYAQAVELLGGVDGTLVPLWWAKKN
jgi:hypothetical protein